MNYLSLIGRATELFGDDIANQRALVKKIVTNSRFLVIGGAGTIGLRLCLTGGKLTPSNEL